MRPTAKTSPTPSSPTVAEYEAAVATEVRLVALGDALRDEELERLARGEKIEAEDIARINTTEAQAEALLRGDAVAKQRKRTIRDIVGERAVVRLALEKAGARAELARREMAAERYANSQQELRDVGRKMVEAIWQLDRALRERDALVNRIGMRAVLPVEAWPLAGRLSNTSSQAYRLAEAGVMNGWISQAEFDKEFAAARKADAWR
jgi:hypothetical protein